MRRLRILYILLLAAILAGGPLTAWLYTPEDPTPQPTLLAGQAIAFRAQTGQPWERYTSTATPFRAVTSTATPTLTLAPTLTPYPTATITPTKTRVPTLPFEAKVKNITGSPQTLPLSCEARAAVDWANFFGVSIPELEFFNRIPKSDDPETGFVGSPYGAWGEIPPAPYGVHAGPVAALLRQYGLKASAGRNLSFNQLRFQIAAGHPVIVWIVGHVEPGTGVEIKINGNTRLVARYEHTVMAIGYNGQTVTMLDDGQVYERKTDIFLKSWGALGNMAVFSGK